MGAVRKGGESHEVQRIVVEHGSSIFQYVMYVNPSDTWDKFKICRKEAKETGYWLRSLGPDAGELDQARRFLLDESIQLVKIFGAILRNTGSREA